MMVKQRKWQRWMMVSLAFLGAFSTVSFAAMGLSSYSFESFSIQNPGFANGTSAQINFNGQTTTPPSLILMAYKFGFLGAEAGLVLRSLEGNIADDAQIEAKVLGTPLFYPNPFSLSSGSELGYKLSKNMDIEVRVYNIRAQEIFRKSFVAGGWGGLYGYNKVAFDRAAIGRYDLPAGIYFFVLMHNGSVLSRGKFAVKP